MAEKENSPEEFAMHACAELGETYVSEIYSFWEESVLVSLKTGKIEKILKI